MFFVVVVVLRADFFSRTDGEGGERGRMRNRPPSEKEEMTCPKPALALCARPPFSFLDKIGTEIQPRKGCRLIAWSAIYIYIFIYI